MFYSVQKPVSHISSTCPASTRHSHQSTCPGAFHTIIGLLLLLVPALVNDLNTILHYLVRGHLLVLISLLLIISFLASCQLNFMLFGHHHLAFLIHFHSIDCLPAFCPHFTMANPQLHLLGLPAEIRLNIWRCIYDDILASKDSQTYEQRTAVWGGLAATSRVIHQETSEFWPRTMIPYHKQRSTGIAHQRLTNLAGGLAASVFRDFRFLTIQLPIQYDEHPARFFRQVAAGLLQLAPVLQDLRIFFIGEDEFGINTNYLGCSLREYSDPPGVTRKLRKDGTSYAERGILFRAVKNLSRLRNLVLSNVNYPILHSLLGHKPMLESLRLLTDSRSILYKHDAGPLIQWHPPPALRTLQISANAVLGAVAVVGKVIASLEDLTFLIPSTDWHRKEKEQWKWLIEAKVLVQNIGLHGKKLRRFRLCIEQSVREETAGDLLGALKQYLPLTNLGILEIHAVIISDYFGRELIEALPRSLKRLYISQELVYVKDLLRAVRDRYFGPKDAKGHQQAGNLGFVTYEYWEGENTRPAVLRMNGALLDRERNAHLFDDAEASSHRFGGGPGNFPVTTSTFRPLSAAELGEDMMSMKAPPEAALEYYEDQSVEHITEAEMVFHAEGAAKAEDRIPFLVIPDNIEIGDNDHWMTDCGN
jgi:hypothetical protein